MFSYVDKNIREKLVLDKKLVTVDINGELENIKNDKKAYMSILGPIPMPIEINNKKIVFSWYPFVRRVQLGKVISTAEKVSSGGKTGLLELLQENMSVNSLLAAPGFIENDEPLVRVHSCCMTGDVFGSMRCECGPQLDYAFEKTAEIGGAIIYMSGHEGRGIGLWAKAATYLLQDEGQDTYQANLSLGLPEDSRDFTDAAVVLKYFLKGNPVKLLSNNPIKQEQLEQAGQKVSKIIPFLTGTTENNLRYLRSKKEKGHLLPEL